MSVTVLGLKKPFVYLVAKANKKDCSLEGVALSCTFDLKIDAGPDTFVVSLYSSSNGSGTPLSTATVLASIKTGQTRNVPLKLEGVPAAILTSVTQMSLLADGGVHTGTFSVSVLDAGGATIIGPSKFKTPLLVYDTNDSEGALKFSPQQITSARRSDTTVTVTYDSVIPLAETQIVISATGATSGSISFASMVVAPVTLNNFLLGGAGQAQTINVSESGFSSAFTLGGANSSVSVTCAPSSCAPASSGSTVAFTFTAQAPGAGSVMVSDALGTSTTIPYRVGTLTRFPNVGSTGNLSNIIDGPDGNLWGVMQSGGSGSIVQSTTSGVTASFPLPSPFNPTATPDGVAGTDSAIWLVDGASTNVYRVSTALATLGQVTQYPTVDKAAPTSIALGPDQQTLYFTDSKGNIGTINEQTHAVGFKVNSLARSSPSTSIVIDASGNVFFLNDEAVFEMSPSGSVSNVKGPLLPGDQLVASSTMIIGPDKNLWVGAPGYLCDLTAAGKTIGCYANANTIALQGLALGSDGAVYASGTNAGNYNALTRTVVGGATTNYTPFDCCADFYNIVVGPDQALWLSYNTAFDRVVP